MRQTLFEKLLDYAESDIYPFCMPGHKRQNHLPFTNSRKGTDPYLLDITEVEGFDDLHRASGILKEITDHAADVYAKCSPKGRAAAPAVFMSVNGSTACNLAAVSAVPDDGPVLIAANCHRSVFHGAILTKRKVIELAPQWISPLAVYGGIRPEDVENALRGYPDIRAVVITSPSYEGLVSDVETIADIVHAHGAFLIVDEAHGAHLPFCKELPVSAIYLGADMVIHSLHKTVGSLNQTALTFVNDPALADSFHKNLLMYMTTSPSYLLMASIEQAVLWAETNSRAFSDYCRRLADLRKELSAFRKLRIIDNSMIGQYNVFDLDRAKIAFYARGTAGEVLYRKFYEDFGLQFEKYGDRYALAMTTVWDTEAGFERLLKAAEQIDVLL